MNGQFLILAIPKGRILPKAARLLVDVGIEIDADQLTSRRLTIDTSLAWLKVSIIRNSDILLAIRSGAADLAIAGSDQLAEDAGDDYYDLYDLGIAKCWLKVAAPVGYVRNNKLVRVATKFARLTRAYYAAKGVQAQVVRLNGAMELAVSMGLADEIVDLVETGKTLTENGLEPVDTLLAVTSHLIANRDRLITQHQAMRELVERFGRVLPASGTALQPRATN